MMIVIIVCQLLCLSVLFLEVGLSQPSDVDINEEGGVATICVELVSLGNSSLPLTITLMTQGVGPDPAAQASKSQSLPASTQKSCKSYSCIIQHNLLDWSIKTLPT